ncbi:MAG: GTP-binding protein [Phycisphaerales bacterium]|nr:GTP-binding protein [Phycisphaerales bacterium]
MMRGIRCWRCRHAAKFWNATAAYRGVVVAGQPNVGKSTLMNKMLGRSASLVADLPGTTRDWVAGWVELEGVALHWMDTPGLRHTD